MYDGNEAGRTGSLNAAAKVIRDTFVRIVQLPSDSEPDDLSVERLQDLLLISNAHEGR